MASKTAKGLTAGLLLVAAIALGAYLVFREAPPVAPRVKTEPKPSPTESLPRVGLVDHETTARESLDAQADGWSTEAFSSRAGARLKDLEKIFAKAYGPSVEKLAETLTGLVSPAFIGTPLEPVTAPNLVFEDPRIRVFRSTESADPQSPKTVRGIAEFATALQGLVFSLGDPDEVKATFKQFKVTVEDDRYRTQAYLTLSGRAKQKAVEINALWDFEWIPGEVPVIKSVAMSHFEIVRVKAPGGRLFSECTEAVLGDTESFNQQLRFGAGYWRDHMDSVLGTDFYGHHGLAVGDVNGDGLDDLYVCQSGGSPNRLYVQQANGTAIDRSASAGVDWNDRTFSALLLDLDNDGDQDLVAATEAGLLFMANDGRGTFEGKSVFNPVQSAYSLTAADYDQDGDLDLYACIYGELLINKTKVSDQVLYPVPYHDANNGGRNVLVRNDGNWTFTDATETAGLDANNLKWSFAAAWEDYDNDGDQDLYVANDFGRNNLFRNEGGRFTDVAAEAGVEDIASGMSVSWGDVNRDGHMDLYIANMFSAAGNRITYQRKFKPGSTDQTRAHLQRLARGNTLFINQGDQGFEDASVDAAVTLGRWAWGAPFMDVNNDGWEDLVCANGYLTNEDTGDL